MYALKRRGERAMVQQRDGMYDALAAALTARGIDVAATMTQAMGLEIETPSWGYANSGTRFRVFPQPGVPRTVEEKLADAAQVQAVTGIAPGVALHIPW